MTFLDTSAIFAFLDKDDDGHPRALREWERAVGHAETLVTTNYVLTETIALCQSRLGIATVQDLAARVMPALRVEWITGDLHAAALAIVLTASRRDMSFVDCTSFEAMRRLGIRRAFTLDEHFREQGFEVVP
jgi:predicted nucleic acid-binding protein